MGAHSNRGTCGFLRLPFTFKSDYISWHDVISRETQNWKAPSKGSLVQLNFSSRNSSIARTTYRNKLFYTHDDLPLLLVSFYIPVDPPGWKQLLELQTPVNRTKLSQHA